MARTERYLNRMKDLLVAHQIISPFEEVKEKGFAELIMTFQEKAGIRVDGDPGPQTLWHMQHPLINDSNTLDLVDCPTHEVKVNGDIISFGNTKLRSDVAELFTKISKEVEDAGGKVTSSGGIRPLAQGTNASRSITSMHYPGLAFDLGVNTGFFKPDSDQFIITRNDVSKPHWLVWCRAEGGEEQELEAWSWSGPWRGGRVRKRKISAKVINFTEIAMKHGFSPIGPRRSFTRQSKKMYLSSEWWHFQANSLLFPEISQFGIELLRIKDYSAGLIQAKNDQVWANHRNVYRKNWF